MATTINTDTMPRGGPVNSQLINSSAAEFRKLRLTSTGRPYDKVVVGAAIVRRNTGSTSASSKTPPAILLLKRAAHEVYFPNVFELPSGKVDPEDRSLRHALTREVKEETGLDVTDVIAELEPMIYRTDKTVVSDTGEDIHVSKTAIQLNYVVSVVEGVVQLSTEEHSESAWATEEMLDGLNITSAMRGVVQEALRWAGK
jgi:8-oxo-dGTP pyrophosphatase MutT (NUDIX family)